MSDVYHADVLRSLSSASLMWSLLLGLMYIRLMATPCARPLILSMYPTCMVIWGATGAEQTSRVGVVIISRRASDVWTLLRSLSFIMSWFGLRRTLGSVSSLKPGWLSSLVVSWCFSGGAVVQCWALGVSCGSLVFLSILDS